jgi:hypothetical protein
MRDAILRFCGNFDCVFSPLLRQFQFYLYSNRLRLHDQSRTFRVRYSASYSLIVFDLLL